MATQDLENRLISALLERGYPHGIRQISGISVELNVPLESIRNIVAHDEKYEYDDAGDRVRLVKAEALRLPPSRINTIGKGIIA